MTTLHKQALLINGKDAITMGIRPGEGFINTITEPLTLKDYIVNESRLEHGKRIALRGQPLLASRDITLEFTLSTSDQADFLRQRAAFLSEMYKGAVTIELPQVSEDVYRLFYLGKSSEYNMNVNRTFACISLKFTEPNPANRGSEDTTDIKTDRRPGTNENVDTLP